MFAFSLLAFVIIYIYISVFCFQKCFSLFHFCHNGTPNCINVQTNRAKEQTNWFRRWSHFWFDIYISFVCLCVWRNNNRKSNDFRNEYGKAPGRCCFTFLFFIFDFVGRWTLESWHFNYSKSNAENVRLKIDFFFLFSLSFSCGMQGKNIAHNIIILATMAHLIVNVHRVNVQQQNRFFFHSFGSN